MLLKNGDMRTSCDNLKRVCSIAGFPFHMFLLIPYEDIGIFWHRFLVDFAKLHEFWKIRCAFSISSPRVPSGDSNFNGFSNIMPGSQGQSVTECEHGASSALKRPRTRMAALFKKKNGPPAAQGFGPVIVNQKKKPGSPFSVMAKSAEIVGVSDGCNCSCRNPFKRKRRKSITMTDQASMSRVAW